MDEANTPSLVRAKGNIKRVIFTNLERGRCIYESLEEIAEEERIEAGAFNLIGALKNANLKYYDQSAYKYRDIPRDEPMEIVSCMGDISIKEDGEIVIHAHAALGDSKGRVWGGHLDRGSCVGVVAEAMILEFEGMKLKRVFNPETRLHHLSPEPSE